MRKHYFIFCILSFFLFLTCRKENFLTDSSAKLNFSKDTVLFDTIFTNFATANKILMVYNPYSKAVKISSIRLSGGSSSFYALNVNGTPGYEFTDLEIFPKDSMYVFVAAKLNEVGQDKPLIVKDSLIFTTNNNQQKVMLISYGQDVNVLKNNHLSTQDWNSDKPYLIFGTVTVDSNQTLTMSEGTRVYMYNNANIIVKGTLIISGTIANRVLIQHTRPEPFYYNKAGQWGKIILTGSSKNNVIENADIYSPVTGIEIGDTNGTAAPDLIIRNTMIVNAKLANLKAFGASITAENCVFANAGEGCVELYKGGKYTFYHCTINNAGIVKFSIVFKTPSLYYNDKFNNNSGILDSIKVINSIIYGGNPSMDIISSSQNYYFKNSIIVLDLKKYNVSDHQHFDSIYYTIPSGNTLLKMPFIDNTEVDKYKYDFMPDSLSYAREKASVPYAIIFPNDLKGNSRVLGILPDIGALQWQPKKK
jgi:hypothetical protein